MQFLGTDDKEGYRGSKNSPRFSDSDQPLEICILVIQKF